MDFLQFAHLNGVEIERLEISPRVQRCGTTDNPRSKNGAYLYEGDRGWVQAWDGDCEVHWWDDERVEPTQADRDEWARRKAQRMIDQLKLWGSTAIRCKMMQDTCKMGEHNYLHRKGLGDVKAHILPDGELFIPMHNVQAGALVGAQLIHWDDAERVFVKKFIPGSRLKQSAMRLGPATNREKVLCEGFSTGWSIRKAILQLNLPATVIVCFNDSNMVEVAPLIKGRKTVFADNDKSGAGERAAKATGLRYAMSPVVGEDANDWHKRDGLMPVMEAIMTARQLEETV
jgi:putative DNA primase/helicase